MSSPVPLGMMVRSYQVLPCTPDAAVGCLVKPKEFFLTAEKDYLSKWQKKLANFTVAGVFT